MSKAAKQVIFILGLLLVVSAVVALSTFSQKASLEKVNLKFKDQISQGKKKISEHEERYKALLGENEGLKKRAQDVLADKKRVQDDLDDISGRMQDIKNNIEEIMQEKDEWKSRYQEVKKERDDTITKLQEAQKKIAEKRREPAVVTKVAEVVVDGEGAQEDHWAGILKQKTEIMMQVVKLEEELNKSVLKIEELKKKNADLVLEVSYLNNEKEEIERKIKYGEDLADNLSIELVREKNDKKYISKRLDKIKEENLELRAHVKQLNGIKIVLEKSISRMQSEKSKVDRRLKETEMIVQDRIDEVINIKNDIDRKLQKGIQGKQEIMLPPIVVNASTPRIEDSFEVPVVTTAGEIISVNEENNFAIINLGNSAGAGVGDKFSVYRDGQYIGDLEIIQVRKDISAADIIQQGMPLKAGDSVK